MEVDGGQIISGNVVVGADGIPKPFSNCRGLLLISIKGLWSIARDQVLGYPSPPHETGDLAYRATLKTADLLALNDDQVTEFCTQSRCTLWMGPKKHCVLYPLKGGSEFNLVLIRPDNLPPGIDKIQGEIGEMRETFKGWDSSLTTIISRIPSVLKWKLCFHDELDTWYKVSFHIPRLKKLLC